MGGTSGAESGSALLQPPEFEGHILVREEAPKGQRIVATTFRLIDNAATRYGPCSEAASAWPTGRMILIVVAMLGVYVLMTL